MTGHLHVCYCEYFKFAHQQNWFSIISCPLKTEKGILATKEYLKGLDARKMIVGFCI